MKIYYAHFIGIYNTKQEEKDLETIKSIFPNDEIINTNSQDNELLYKTIGMDLFFKLIEQCDMLIFRGMINGKITAGVYSEINFAKTLKLPILELPSYVNRGMSVNDTRQTLIELGIR